MKTNGRFAMALHVLAVMAYKEGDATSSELLSASVNTNPVIIRRLLRLLQRARLVETRRGPHAGSRLSRSPSRITLAEVYSAVCQADLFCLPRRRPNVRCPVGHEIRSVLRTIFASAHAALAHDLAKTSLATILQSVRTPARKPAARNRRGKKPARTITPA